MSSWWMMFFATGYFFRVSGESIKRSSDYWCLGVYFKLNSISVSNDWGGVFMGVCLEKTVVVKKESMIVFFLRQWRLII
ncbi:MAG: hypothetical protein ABIN48_03855 [Ginsengibacter sp.]